MPNDATFHEASVIIEQAGTNKYKIQSDQLEQIGTQLRGRREFSIFHSIILPLIVSVATVIFSSIFQYVSWFNQVSVKYTTDVADKATFSESTASKMEEQYEALLGMADEFRCYAHQRIEYYNSQKDLAIVSINYVWRWLTDAPKTEALNHLKTPAVDCKVNSHPPAPPAANPGVCTGPDVQKEKNERSAEKFSGFSRSKSPTKLTSQSGG
jgi:hypothetical protein